MTVRARGIYLAQMKPKLLISIGHRQNLWRIFRLSDEGYVRQMKLFDFMNCRASWTPDKLHGSPHPPRKKTSLRCIRHTECDIKDFLKRVDEFRTNNIA